MKEYEIWSEGYNVRGNSASAVYIGKSTGRDFRHACIKFWSNGSHEVHQFNSVKLTFWGCKLFSNERQARRNYG